MHIHAGCAALIASSSACRHPSYCNVVFYIATMGSLCALGAIILPICPSPYFCVRTLSMLSNRISNRICSGCGRQVRLSTAIQSPKCPACQFSLLPPIPETRPCLRCHVPIPAESPNIRCMRCEAVRHPEPRYTPCYDCRAPFIVRPGVMRCSSCRMRRLSVVQRPSDFRQTASASFDPTLNTLNLYRPISAPMQIPLSKRRRSLPAAPTLERQPSVLYQAVTFLLQEHESRVCASGLFLPDVSVSLVRRSMARFELEMEVASRDVTCYSCGLLTPPPTGARQVLEQDPIIRPLEGFLDQCGFTNGFWNLCPGCHAALLRGSVPKFSALNKINVTLCQNYPEALTDLTLTEEYLIAKSHPVGVVLKLRPGGRSSPASYFALRGHFIIIPQNPKPLLQILPSPELQFTELIKVFWMGKHRPNKTDLRPFLVVRKTKVLAAL